MSAPTPCQVLFCQLDVRTINRRGVLRLDGRPAAADGFPRRVVKIIRIFRNSASALRDISNLPAPLVHGNVMRRRGGNIHVWLVTARIAVADADDAARAFHGEMNLVLRHRHDAALRVQGGNGEHRHVCTVGIDGFAIRRELDLRGARRWFPLSFPRSPCRRRHNLSRSTCPARISPASSTLNLASSPVCRATRRSRTVPPLCNC